MPRAFIAMPFAQTFFPVYKAMRSACEQLGITTIRIDEVWAREDIYQQIEEEILKADFIIVDFTGDQVMEIPNPNVVHEAAFARTHKKYVLLMTQDHKSLPFDWRTRPALIYQSTEEGLIYLKERLVMTIQALLKREDFGKDTTPRAPVPAQPQAMNMFQTMAANPGQPAYPAMAFESNPAAVMQNLLLAREGQVPPITASNTLPAGFRQQDGKVVCDYDISEMVIINAGTFAMGGEEDSDQKPIHEVYLSTYLMDVYPVANSQYAKFIEAGGYRYQGYWAAEGWAWRCQHRIEAPAAWDTAKGRLELPVVGVSWYEAFAYATWCGKHLPSEAEWEYAARGNDRRVYPWGNEPPSKELANYKGRSPTPCGQYKEGVSPAGCHDMAGNVWEWCFDGYQEAYYQKSSRCNPLSTGDAKEKVCRGGAWTYDADTLKTFYRFCGKAMLRDRGYGFRCARIL